MIKSPLTLPEVKKTIQALHQKKVEVVIELGRNKRQAFTGHLTGVYPALFKITPIDDSFTGKTSYSYSEYLCGKVKLKESLKKESFQTV